MSDPSLDALLVRVWARLGPERRADAHELSEALAEVRDDADPAAWSRVRQLAHRLAGSLGSLGQHAAGREALAMEELTSGVEQPDEALLVRLSGHATALLEHLATPPDSAGGQRPRS